MKNILIISVVLLTLCSCEKAYLADAKKSLADSIQTNMIFCNYSINNKISNNYGTIGIRKRTDQSIGIELLLHEDNDAWTKIVIEDIQLSGTLNKIIISNDLQYITIHKQRYEDDIIYKTTAAIEGWLHNKEITRAKEQWEYEIEGELTIKYIINNTKETVHVYNMNRKQPQ
ncbi:MAG: hypothetical protein J5533_02235 [Bacteroidales bacterium]|nr:hypothetical protein [Bacteroidales bacterium]